MSRVVLNRPDAAQSRRLIAQADEWTAAPEPDAEPDACVWDLRQIRNAARVACSRIRMNPSAACDDLGMVAESAVGLAVAETPAVSWGDAVFAATRAVYDAVSATRQSHGMDTAGEWRPRYVAYWLTGENSLPAPTAIVNQLALTQVFAALPERHVRTLWAQAFADSTAAAAASQGVGEHTYRCRLTTARKVALSILFDHEPPPALSRLPINQRGRDRECGRCGRPIAGENAWVIRRAGRVVEQCRGCRIEREQERRRKDRELT